MMLPVYSREVIALLQKGEAAAVAMDKFVDKVSALLIFASMRQDGPVALTRVPVWTPNVSDAAVAA